MAERNFDKMHAWVEERLSDYVDGQLTASERAQTEQHLRDCAGCRTSLESLRWSMSLIKQAPAPKLPRSFVLPVPEKRAPAFGFVALRFATVAATLLLFALIATEFVTQFGGAPLSAPAPAQVMREAAPATSAPVIAFVPTQPAAPTKAPAAAALPTSAPKPTSAPMATKAPEPTKAAAPAAPAVLPTSAPKPVSAPTTASTNASEVTRTVTPVTGLGGGAPETTTPVADGMTKSAPVVAPRVVASPTALPSPTTTLAPTLTLAPTATNVPTRVALVAPTTAPPVVPASKVAPQQPTMFSPQRVAKFVVWFAVVFHGALTLLLWRRR